MEVARQLRLRPGWYPDPDGQDCYRRYDGARWLDDVRPVQARDRERFARTQRALLKRIDDIEAALERRGAPRATHAGARPRRPHDAPVIDPGGPLGWGACALAIVQLWPIALFAARASRLRSAEAGLPRNLGASLGISIAALDVLLWLLLAVAVVLGSR